MMMMRRLRRNTRRISIRERRREGRSRCDSSSCSWQRGIRRIRTKHKNRNKKVKKRKKRQS